MAKATFVVIEIEILDQDVEPTDLMSAVIGGLSAMSLDSYMIGEASLSIRQGTASSESVLEVTKEAGQPMEVKE
jgi:hypothetical protein